MSEQGFGDFEFERKFFVREVPEAAALDPAPTLIVQAYLFAADGYAVRKRRGDVGWILQSGRQPSAPDEAALGARLARRELLAKAFCSRLIITSPGIRKLV